MFLECIVFICLTFSVVSPFSLFLSYPPPLPSRACVSTLFCYLLFASFSFHAGDLTVSQLFPTESSLQSQKSSSLAPHASLHPSAAPSTSFRAFCLPPLDVIFMLFSLCIFPCFLYSCRRSGCQPAVPHREPLAVTEVLLAYLSRLSPPTSHTYQAPTTTFPSTVHPSVHPCS